MTELLRDRYEPLEVVGQGGEGRVLKAIDRQHDRLVALKVRTVDGDSDREQLLHEAGLLLAIRPHPNLPLVREDFLEGDSYVIAMDWIEGTDLARLLRARGHPGLSPSSVLGWLADAASALTHLHTQDQPVVHGDVKPANLILTTGGRVVLVDFGLSSAPDSPRRRGGTVGFAAPELAAGQAPTRASDVYSLAATAFALLTGEAPAGIRPTWDGIDPDAAAQLEAAVRAALATDPVRRPETAGEFVELLRAGWGSTLPTGVLTFLLTDIEGSTALWDADPDGMSRALVHHDELVADVMERHRGRCVKSMGEGDASVSVFPAALDALDAAIELQQRLSDPGDSHTDEPALRVRAALHTGEAEQRGADYFGTTLNVAARLRGLADGSQVFLSSATAALVEPGLPAGTALVDLGPHRLRGLRHAENVFALAAPGVVTPPAATACPYPGLLAFEPADADLFFGRDAVVADIVQRLQSESFVALVGASGSGKSSVLRAGLVCAWGDAAVTTPGARPDPIPDGPDLVVVDQLEEVFTLCTDANRRAELLSSLAARSGPVAVGLRADFYGHFAEHASFARKLAASQVLLGPMTDDELRDAIIGPAATAGLRIDPALVDVLVDEVSGEPGALPLLSHALRATWENRDGRTITIDAYRATGGVRSAIATTAEQVYAALEPSDQELARRTFLALTEPGEGTEDSRRRATIAELTPVGGDDRLATLLDAMARARLVTVDEGTVEVAHEALIRNWPRLRAWLDEDRDGLRIRRHLIAAAEGWDALGRDPAELYRGPRLTTALEATDRGQLSALEVAFLDASVAEQERGQRAQARTNRRLRGLLVGAGVALVVALLAGVWAIDRQRDASDSRDQADISRVAAESRSTVDRQPDLGLLLAAAAYELDDNADTRNALLQALETHPLLEGLIYGSESGLEEAVFTPDGRVLVTPTSDGTGTILWDTATRQQIDVLRDGRQLSLDAAVSPDGKLLVVPTVYATDDRRPGGRLQVWDLETRELVESVESPVGGLTTAAFSADGSRLFTQGGLTADARMRSEVVVWDTESWAPMTTWVIDDQYVDDETFVVSDDGTRAAAPLSNGAIGTYRTTDQTPLGPPIEVRALADDPTGPVLSVALGPRGEELAIATEVGGVFVVDPVTGAVLQHIEIPESIATALEVSPDGTVLAVGRLDGRTQLYDLATGEPAGPPLAASAAEIADVSFNADGTELVTTGRDRTGAFWRLDGGRAIGIALAGQDAPVTEATFSADGTRLLTAALDGTVAVRDAATGASETTVRMPGEVLSVSADPTGPRFAAGGTERVVVADDDGEVTQTLDVGDAWAMQVAFAPDGSVVAIAVDRVQGDPETSGPGTGAVEFFDPDTGEPVGPSIELDESAIGVAYSPDGAQVAVIAYNNLVHFYSTADGRELGPPIENVDAPFAAAAFSPDGTRIALGISTGAVRQYDVESHEPVGEQLEGDPNGVYGVAYSPDGSLLAATSLGFSTTRLWDVDTGRSVGTRLTGGRVPYSYQTFNVEHVMGSRPAFSADGGSLITPGFEGATVYWDLDPVHWAAAACDMAGRELTEEEWDRYLPGRDHRYLCADD